MSPGSELRPVPPTPSVNCTVSKPGHHSKDDLPFQTRARAKHLPPTQKESRLPPQSNHNATVITEPVCHMGRAQRYL